MPSSRQTASRPPRSAAPKHHRLAEDHEFLTHTHRYASDAARESRPSVPISAVALAIVDGHGVLSAGRSAPIQRNPEPEDDTSSDSLLGHALQSDEVNFLDEDESSSSSADARSSSNWDESSSSGGDSDPLLGRGPRSDGADAHLIRTSDKTAAQVGSAVRSIVSNVSSSAGHAIGLVRSSHEMLLAHRQADTASQQSEQITDQDQRELMRYIAEQSGRKYKKDRATTFSKLSALIATVATVATGGAAMPLVAAVGLVSTAQSAIDAIHNLRKRWDGTLGKERRKMANAIYDVARAELESFDFNGPFLGLVMRWKIKPKHLVNDKKMDQVVSKIFLNLASN